MNWLDIVVLLVTAIAGLVGLWAGLVRVGATLVGLIAGIAIASRFHAGLADSVLSHIISSPSGAKVAAFLLILFLVILAALLLAFVIKKLLSLLMLGWLDRVAGLALGVAVCLAGFSALLSAVYANSLFDMRPTIDGSFMGRFLLDQYGSLLEALKLVPRNFGSPLQ